MRDSEAAVVSLSDDDAGVQRALHRVYQTVEELAVLDESLAEARDLLDSAAIQIDEAASSLRHYQDAMDLDPNRMQAVDEQLGSLHELARKHRVTTSGLAELLSRLQAEVDVLEHADSSLAALEQQTQAAENAYRDAAGNTLADLLRAAAAVDDGGDELVGRQIVVAELVLDLCSQLVEIHDLLRPVRQL